MLVVQTSVQGTCIRPLCHAAMSRCPQREASRPNQGRLHHDRIELHYSGVVRYRPCWGGYPGRSALEAALAWAASFALTDTSVLGGGSRTTSSLWKSRQVPDDLGLCALRKTTRRRERSTQGGVPSESSERGLDSTVAPNVPDSAQPRSSTCATQWPDQPGQGFLQVPRPQGMLKT